MGKIVKDNSYSKLLSDIGDLLTMGRKSAELQINTILVETYWRIGYRIVEFEQKGHDKPDYGSNLLTKLSKDLKLKYGKGFSKSNIYHLPDASLLYKIRKIPDSVWKIGMVKIL